MAKREKGSPRTGRTLWELQSEEDAAAGISAKRFHPYGRRSPWGVGNSRVRGESGDTGDEGYEDTAAPVEDFKKGGSVKVRGSGIATQGVRPAKMVKMKGS